MEVLALVSQRIKSRDGFLFLPSLDTLIGLIFSPQSQPESLCLTEQSGGVEMCQKVQDWKSLEAIVP
jgi:hypothetical protein